MRKVAALVATFTFFSVGFQTATHAADPTSAYKHAQAEANEAARKYAESQAEMAKAQGRIASTRKKLKEAQNRIASSSRRVREIAINQYMDGGQSDSFLGTSGDFNDDTRRDTVLNGLQEDSKAVIDTYIAAKADLKESQDKLDEQLDEQREILDKSKSQRAAAEAKLRKLSAQLASFKRSQRAAAAASNPSVPAPQGAGGSFAGNGPWMCPVQGPHAFSNDFGAPRYGGGYHTHQGNDIISPRGTPVVANVSGFVKRHANGLGGLAYYLEGSDGVEYYGAHLSAYGAQGQVSMGTVIGYVGNTGDASGGVNHLHFEAHPGGGGAVSPYSWLSKYC